MGYDVFRGSSGIAHILLAATAEHDGEAAALDLNSGTRHTPYSRVLTLERYPKLKFGCDASDLAYAPLRTSTWLTEQGAHFCWVSARRTSSGQGNSAEDDVFLANGAANLNWVGCHAVKARQSEHCTLFLLPIPFIVTHLLGERRSVRRSKRIQIHSHTLNISRVSTRGMRSDAKRSDRCCIRSQTRVVLFFSDV